MRKRILQDADQASRKEASERVAAGGGEADGDEQWKIEDVEKRKTQRQPRLKEDGSERNENGRGDAKAVNLNLLS